MGSRFANGGWNGKTSFQDLAVVKRVDRTSPELALACAEGTLFAKVVVELLSEEKNSPLASMAYHLTNCVVTSVSPAGAADVTLTEHLAPWRLKKSNGVTRLRCIAASNSRIRRHLSRMLDASGVRGRMFAFCSPYGHENREPFRSPGPQS